MPSTKTTNGRIDIVATEEGWSRSCSTAEGSTDADVDTTAASYSANLAGSTLSTIGASGQATARRATVNAVSGAFCSAGAYTTATGAAWPEGGARLAGTGIARAGTIDAAASGTLEYFHYYESKFNGFVVVDLP